jgi:hypothetical protein
MDRNDEQAIRQLFEKLASVERQSPPRDPQAEDFISRQVERLPGAPYYMAQTIVAQEQALEAAQRRIVELEGQSETEAPLGGVFGNIFGGRPERPSRSVPQVPRARDAGYAPAPGGGFLAGAAQTAMGVAGGVLLGNFLAGMLGSESAQAGEQSPTGDDAQSEEAAFDDGGDAGDAGDFGDF